MRKVIQWKLIWHIVATAFVLLCFFSGWDSETGFTSNLRFGDYFEETLLPEVQALPIEVWEDSRGYDGQFYAQMALRPSVSDEEIQAAVDAPDYRFRRILLSWMAAALGFGNDWLTLNVYASLNLLFWLLTGILLLHWAPPTSVENLARWLGAMFGVGAISSIQLAILDLPAAFFILLAVYLLEKNRNCLSATALAAAILTREVSLVAGVMRLGDFRPWKTKVVHYAVFGLIALCPFFLWMLYLNSLGYGFSSGSSGNFSAPFSGLRYEFNETLTLLAQGKTYNAIALLSLCTQLIALLLLSDFRSPLWRVGASYCLLAVFLGTEVWLSEPGAAYRVLTIVTFAFNLLLKKGPLFWPVMLLGNLSTIIAFDYLTRWL